MPVKKFIAAGMLMAAAASAHADRLIGTVKGFAPYSSNGKQVVIFKVVGGAPGGCNWTGSFAIDSSSDYFKLNFAGLLAAYQSQTPITVQYVQTCNSQYNSWDVQIICFGEAICY